VSKPITITRFFTLEYDIVVARQPDFVELNLMFSREFREIYKQVIHEA